MKKYELTDDCITFMGRKLFRIRALINFNDVVAGDLGGYIENEENLSHSGDAWVYDTAQIYDGARVYGDAQVYGGADVYDNARIYDDANVFGDAQIFGNARVSGNAQVYGDTHVCGNAWVYNNTQVSGNAWVYNNTQVFGNAQVSGNAQVYEYACVYGDARVSGNARVSSNAWVCNCADYLYFQGLGSEYRSTTFFKCADGHIHVSCGCFSGNLTEFRNKIKETHGDNKYAKEYLACIEVVQIHFKGNIDVDQPIGSKKKENALVECEDIPVYAEENTEDVVPVVHGEWIAQYVSTRGLTNVFSCSNCNENTYLLHKKAKCYFNYCPSCGAKMEV